MLSDLDPRPLLPVRRLTTVGLMNARAEIARVLDQAVADFVHDLKLGEYEGTAAELREHLEYRRERALDETEVPGLSLVEPEEWRDEIDASIESARERGLVRS
jgi:hypothetical protein